MTTRQIGIFAATAFVIAMIALLPLRLALGLRVTGLAARAVTGSIWSGRLADAQWRGAGIGNLEVGLSPLPLLAGRLRLAVAGTSVRGVVTPNGVTGLIGQVALAGVTPLPVSSIGFDGVDIVFSDGVCRAAKGQVQVLTRGVLVASEAFSGTARCDAGKLLLPLVSGRARLDLRIGGDGRYAAGIAIDTIDETARPGLIAAGFQPTPQGLALTLEGSL